MEEWAAQVGKPKRTDRVVLPQGLEELVGQLTKAQLEDAFRCVGASGMGMVKGF
jgi:hypothetical protein